LDRRCVLDCRPGRTGGRRIAGSGVRPSIQPDSLRDRVRSIGHRYPGTDIGFADTAGLDPAGLGTAALGIGPWRAGWPSRT
jgi:hypothetical protein